MLQMHREAMRQHALAEILVQEVGLAREKFAERADHFFEFGFDLRPHAAPTIRKSRNVFYLTRFLHARRFPPRSTTLWGQLTCEVSYIKTSISRGPFSATPSASAFTKSSTLSTERADTPMPFAKATKSMVGRSSLSMSCARLPGSPAPTPSNSPRRIW